MANGVDDLVCFGHPAICTPHLDFETIITNQVNTALATSMDLFPTIVKLVQADQPKDRVLDDTDIMSLLTDPKEAVRNVVFYYKSFSR
ncbi:MAG: hypothetical protein ACYCZO_07840 [Daejeonella sp.]